MPETLFLLSLVGGGTLLTVLGGTLWVLEPRDRRLVVLPFLIGVAMLATGVSKLIG